MGSAPATETHGVTRAAARAAPTKQVWLGSAGGWGHSPCQGADSPRRGEMAEGQSGAGRWAKPKGGKDRPPLRKARIGTDGRAGLGPAPTGRGQSGSARRSRLRSPSATNSCPCPHIRRAGAESRTFIYIFWKLQHNCLLKQKSASRSGGAFSVKQSQIALWTISINRSPKWER